MALRFGLFGTGYWAAEVHAAGLAAHPDATLVGVWGRDPDKVAALAGRYGARPYDDVDALLADVDAVAVALPPDVQVGLAVRAARAGRHLLLDKPVALSVEDADAIVGAVDADGLSSLVFTTNRYRPEVDVFLAEAIATGGWSGARVTYYGANFTPGNPYAGSAWRDEHGGLWDLGPHALSVLVPVLGPPGPAILPALGTTPVEAFQHAVTRLDANVSSGVTEDPLDVRAGRDAVAVLVAARTSAETGRTVRV